MERIYTFVPEVDLTQFELDMVKSIYSEPLYRGTKYGSNAADLLETLVVKGLVYLDEDFWYRATEVGASIAGT